MTVLENQMTEISTLCAGVPESKETYCYAEGKWSIREVIGHLIDGERIFGYRAFCISRGETAPLPSFDENFYVTQSRYDKRTLTDLTDELLALRRTNLAFMHWLEEADWLRQGTASNKVVSVRAIAYIMAGHILHHFNGLRSNYGI
jgi:hypothetical protein